jgi:signal transduction histidine kinase
MCASGSGSSPEGSTRLTGGAWQGAAAVLGAAALAVGVGVGVILQAGVLEYPAEFAAMSAWVVLGLTAAGLFWRARRPTNPIGLILLVFSFCSLVRMLQGVDQSMAFSVGVLFDLPGVLLAFYAILAFPSGHLDRAARRLMVAVAALLGTSFIAWMLTSPEIQGGSPVTACKGPCPPNALAVVEGERAGEIAWDLFQSSRLVTAIAIAAILIVRMSRASAPRRRALAPVAFVAITWIVALGAYGLGVNVLGAGAQAETALTAGLVVAASLLALAFLAAPLLSRAFAGLALERMIERIGTETSVERREAVIAEALDDPRLRLAFWLPGAHSYVDREAHPIERPAAGSGLAWTAIGADHPPEAALVHDSALCEEPELLRAAGRTLMLAIDNGRLKDELEAQAADLAASRSRLLVAETTDRHRLERQLHDRTQQQLVALRIRLGLAAVRTGGDDMLARLLTQFGSDLEEALRELRGISRELYPPLLADEGIPSALAALARRADVARAHVRGRGVGRYPEEVEAAVYFALEEAISIAATMPGGAAGLRIDLWEEAGVLRFELSCHGPAGRAVEARVPGMAALVGAVGGHMEVWEAPGRGLVVSGAGPGHVGRAIDAKGGSPVS